MTGWADACPPQSGPGCPQTAKPAWYPRPPKPYGCRQSDTKRASSTRTGCPGRDDTDGTMPVTAIRLVEDEVRELVRRRNLDPLADPAAVHRLVEDVVAEYSERALTSGLPDLPDADDVVRNVVHAVAGFGPLQPYLDESAIEEIWIIGRLTVGSLAPSSVILGERQVCGLG